MRYKIKANSEKCYVQSREMIGDKAKSHNLCGLTLSAEMYNEDSPLLMNLIDIGATISKDCVDKK